MKKLAAFGSTLAGYLSLAYITIVHAQIDVTQPTNVNGGTIGYPTISSFLAAALRLIFIIALILALVMLVWGAVEWIFSGGSKEGVDNARKRIIHALVGLAVLAIAFALVTLAGNFLGLSLLGHFTIPSPANPTPGLPAPSAS